MKKQGGVRLKNRSVLYQWVIAYSIFLVLLLSSGIFLNHVSIRAIREETINSKQYFLMAVNSDIQKMMEQAQQVYNTIYFNRSFIAIGNAQSLSADVRYEIYSLITDLRDGSLHAGGLEYLVYYPDLDIVISEHGSMDSDTYYNFYIKDRLMSYQDYQLLINSQSKNRSFLLHDGGYQLFCYAGTSFAQSGGGKANIVIFLPEERFQSLLEGYFEYDINAIAIRDSQNETILFHSLPDSSVIENFMKETHDGNLFEIQDGEDLIVGYTEPLMNNWNCYLFSYAGDFWRQSAILNRLSGLIICAGMFLCVIGSGIILYRSYTPVRRLMDQIHRIVPAASGSGNEYQELWRVLNYIHADNRKKVQQIEETEGRLRDEVILKLLHGKADTQEINFFTGELLGDSFLVAAIYCTEADPEQTVRAFFSSVQRNSQTVVLRDRKQLVLLKCLAEEDTECAEEFISDLSGLAEDITDQYGAEHGLCINPEAVPVDNLYTAYKEVNKALEYKRATHTDEIFSNRILSGFAVRSYYFPLNIEYELSRQIRQGDFEGAKKQLDILFQINFSQEPLHLYMTRCLLYDIIGTLVKSLDSQDNPQEIRMLENVDIDLDSNDEDSLHRIHQEIENVMRVICESLQHREKRAPAISSTKLEQIARVKSYISENLADPSLNQEGVAAALSMSVSQLSRLFREVEGNSVVEYINQLRMEKVKDALSHTDKSIDEISTDCGYSGAKTLTRLFKKYEGITPGMWRKLHSSGSEETGHLGNA